MTAAAQRDDDEDKAPEPHPLPLTRQWVEDFKRYGTDPKPEAVGEQPKLTVPVDANGCPNLQALVERAGRRHAAALGEEYVQDPFKRPPHQGGYPHITPEEWAEYDRAMTTWQERRRQKP
jgi:hypothetical protein